MKVLLNTESITDNETKISKFTRQWPFKAHLPWNTAERKVRIRAPTDQGSPPGLTQLIELCFNSILHVVF